MPASRVVRSLDKLITSVKNGELTDNGLELILLALAQWAEDYGVMLGAVKKCSSAQLPKN